MAILRIESLLYGVDDLDTCTRFLTDLGLQPVQSGPELAEFRTPVNQTVVLRRIGDPLLPSTGGEGPGIREVVWGVDDAAGIGVIRRELSKDRTVSESPDGSLHTHDDSGHGLGFRVADIAPPPDSVRDYNSPTRINRINRMPQLHHRPHPVQIIHVALDVLAAGHDAGNDFYIQRLGFRVIDDSRQVGRFMQCEGDMQHHNLLLVHRTDHLSTNHVAFEVSDYDEVIEGGNYLTEQGWKESRRLGRHTLGSNVFRFFQSPCGGRIELAHDMDRIGRGWKTRVWEKAPPHHLWMLKFPGDVNR